MKLVPKTEIYQSMLTKILGLKQSKETSVFNDKDINQ